MAELTDEEKAQAVLGDVEVEKPDETTEKAKTGSEEEKEHQEVEGQESEEESTEKPEEEASTEPETTTTFTKQFSNLKGENWEDYGKELETAYVNSSNEALRLKKELDDTKPVIEQAKQIIANGGQTPPANSTATTPPVNQNLLELDSHPAIQYAKSQMNRDMISAFDDFAKEFPQARETSEFDKFTQASAGVAQAYAASHGGTQPTYSELFSGIANILGWQPATKAAKRDAAIKETSASSQTVSSTQPVGKQSKITDDQVSAYLRMFPAKSRADAVKELSEVV